MIEVGMKAPNFKLPNQNGEFVELSDFLGKKVVLYFYPKNHTPGCTTQACGFRDNFEVYKKNDIVVIGISKDTIESHQKFISDYELPFILLADPNLEAVHAYDVWKEKNMYGKKSFGVARSTFVINEEGNIIKIYKKAKADKNPVEILEYLKIK